LHALQTRASRYPLIKLIVVITNYKKLTGLTIASALFILGIALTSCYSLKPVVPYFEHLQTLTPDNLRIFDGDYNVFSNDTSYWTSEDALINADVFNYEQRPVNCDRVRLKAISRNRMEVSVFKDGTIIKKRIIKGRITNNYFEFRLRKFTILYIVFNGISFTHTRISLLKNGDLTADCYAGGFLTLVIVPTFGSGDEHYDLVYKRRDDCH
jgi:hypothetical protein